MDKFWGRYLKRFIFISLFVYLVSRFYLAYSYLYGVHDYNFYYYGFGNWIYFGLLNMQVFNYWRFSIDLGSGYALWLSVPITTYILLLFLFIVIPIKKEVKNKKSSKHKIVAQVFNQELGAVLAAPPKSKQYKFLYLDYLITVKIDKNTVQLLFYKRHYWDYIHNLQSPVYQYDDEEELYLALKECLDFANDKLDI